MKSALISAICCMMICLGVFPERCISAASDALRLCAGSVIPALFPFFVCSSLLVSFGAAELCSRFLSGIMRPLFGVDGAGAVAVVTGLISGYPVGADCAARLYESGRINKDEAERLCAFCNNSGPLFIIGTVGLSLGGSAEIGRMLYLIHMTSALISGILLAGTARGRSRAIPEVRCISEVRRHRAYAVLSALGDAVSRAVSSILVVCGFVMFFSVFESCLPDFSGKFILNSLLEITGGIRDISAALPSGAPKLSLISAVLAFSGLSVFLQVAAILSKARLSPIPYIKGKLLQGVIAFVLTFVWTTFLNNHEFIGVYSGNAEPIAAMDIRQYLILVCGEIVWCMLSIVVLVLTALLTSPAKKGATYE